MRVVLFLIVVLLLIVVFDYDYGGAIYFSGNGSVVNCSFVNCSNGAAAYEKRGVAVMVPEWDSEKCIQCNSCSYVCPHATIRPFALSEDEAANIPSEAQVVDIKAGAGKGTYKFTIAVSPLDCMGCAVCIRCKQV